MGPRGNPMSHVRVASRSQGINFETKIFSFRCFLALMTESSHTTSHYYPKYEVWAVENSLWWDPFNVREERLPCLVLIFCSAQAAAVVAEAVKCGFCINASFAVSGLPEHCPIFHFPPSSVPRPSSITGVTPNFTRLFDGLDHECHIFSKYISS